MPPGGDGGGEPGRGDAAGAAAALLRDGEEEAGGSGVRGERAGPRPMRNASAQAGAGSFTGHGQEDDDYRCGFHR
ncbi:hypothetical protein AB0L03_32455, partial [Streptomyces roseoverticillatus]